MSIFIQKLRAFNELVVFEHTVFSLPFIFISMITASGGVFGWKLLFLGILAVIFARNFAMAANRYADKEYDCKNPRTRNRPSVDGRIGNTQLLSFILLNGVGFVAVGYFVNYTAFLVSLPILVVLGFYSYVKRFSALAHLFLGICLALAPIAGAIAVLESVPVWALFLSLGVLFWVAGFDVLYALQDEEFDKKMGLYSIPSLLGKQRAKLIAMAFHTLSVLFWFMFTYLSGGGLFLFLGYFCSLFLLIYQNYLVYKSESNINRAFFTVNGYMGVIFLVFTILDKVYE